MATQQHHTPSSQNKAANSRRRFIKKASAGAALTAIPAKSVWATGGSLVNSIQASAHASGWTDGELKLLSHGWWKNQGKTYSKAENFVTVFGNYFNEFGYPDFTVKAADAPLNALNDEVIYKKSGNTNLYKELQNLSLFNVVEGENVFPNVYVQIAGMYLNARHDGDFGLNFPVWNAITERPFASLADYAKWLYENAQDSMNSANFGNALSDLINNNHA